MAIYTIQELDEEIAIYKKASKALGYCQSYKIAGREFVYADLAQIRKTLASLDLQRSALQYGAGPKCVVGRIVRR